MKNMNTPPDTFDILVTEYNEWLTSSERPREAQKMQTRSRLRNFFEGAASILDIFGTSLPSSPMHDSSYSNPLEGRNLTPEQEDAIALASDMKRVEQRLNKIASGEVEDTEIPGKDVEAGKAKVKKLYEHYRGLYMGAIL